MDSNSRLPQQFQVLIQSPDVKSLNRALTLTLDEANRTFHDLKFFLLSPSQLSSSFFSINGKTLDDSATIVSAGIVPFSTLTLHFKLFGGGGDGGATGAESRDCYLNMYAVRKPDKVDPNEQRLSKWTTCALSFEPLKPPCVIDRLGNVFNKEALVKALLGKNLPKAFGHIKGLKDMITIHLSVIPGLDLDENAHVGSETRFQCPISGLEFNGKYKFFALRSCGHVLSAKALKEVKSSACLVCHKEFVEADKIVINGTDEEVGLLREKMEAEKVNKVMKEKKPKKGKSGEVELKDGEHVSLDSSARLSGKKHGIDVNGVEKNSGKLELINDKVANDAAAAKGGAPAAQAKRFKAVDIAPPNADKKVYASIFTSSSKSDFKETFTCRSLPLGRN